MILALTVASVGGVMAMRDSRTLLIVSMALIIWFAFEWSIFVVRVRITSKGIRVRRIIRDSRGPVSALWTGQSFLVEVTVSLTKGRLPLVKLNDRAPVAADLIDGTLEFQGQLDANTSAMWEFQAQARQLGMVRFEGVRVRLADYQGFFFHELFLRDPIERPVLPVLAEADSRRGDKRLNLLPPPGVHRHRRPGTGSELLELRDYRPGDPPRRIAWKISARRDQLITREYESEVPLRCTMILDAGSMTRLGQPGQSALARFCKIAATVAQSAIGHRDLVGLAVCDENDLTYLRPARTSAQLIDILKLLARAASLSPIVDMESVKSVLPRAHTLASDLYPDLMSHSINRFPAWLPWLCPPPVYIRLSSGRLATSFLARWRQVFRIRYRRRYAWRKRVAAVIAAKYALPPGATALLLEDDASAARWMQHFLAEHRVPYEVPGRAITDHETISRQARALIHAVSRGRDNELFVLMGEYVGRAGQLDDLLRAVRVARARHHQVLIVQPGQPPDQPGPLPMTADVKLLLRHAEQSRRARGWRTLRKAFGRMGALVLPAASGDPARLILHRLEQLRAIQGARP